MRKSLIAVSVATLFSAPSLVMAQAAAPASPHTFSYNVGVVSDYLFRGISQTRHGAAIQGGVDYSHSSGLYAGVWASNITWVKDWLGKGSTEIDFYGGYKGAFGGGDVGYDVGLIHYSYPGKGASTAGLAGTYGPLFNPTTTEVYGAVSYKWVTAKYSHVVSKDFIGWVGTTGGALDITKHTRGSNYFELNAAYDMGNGWGLSGHVGTQKVKNLGAVTVGGNTLDADYTDWNIGVTKDVGFGVVGLTYSDTDVKGTCVSAAGGTNPYCWGKNMNTGGSGFKDAAEGTAVLSFKKTF